MAKKVAPVPAQGMNQINNVAQYLTGDDKVTGLEGYLILESADEVRGWASQIDNLTQDPSMEQSQGETKAAVQVLIPSSASKNQFLTSLIIINHSGVGGQVQIRPRDINGNLLKDIPAQTLKGNGYISYEDFYQSVGLSNVYGPIEVEAEGGIEITATARIYTRQGTSGYFQGVDVNQKAREVVLPYSLDSVDFRTDLGVTNPGDSVATVTVRLIGKDGKTLNSTQTTVPAHGMTQINRINQALGNLNREGYLRLQSDQPIFGWTAQIDNLSEDLSLVVGKAAGTEARLLIPSTSTTGKFKSSLAVINLSTAATLVRLTARDNGGKTSQLSDSITIPGNGFISSSDILSSLGLTETYGPLEIESLDGQPLQAVSRVYSPRRTGGYFEGVRVEP